MTSTPSPGRCDFTIELGWEKGVDGPVSIDQKDMQCTGHHVSPHWSVCLELPGHRRPEDFQLNQRVAQSERRRTVEVPTIYLYA